MRRKIKTGIITLVITVALVAIFSGNVIAGDGPAPNSGDGTIIRNDLVCVAFDCSASVTRAVIR